MEYKSLSPNIGVKNVEETVQFYTEILGFKLAMSVSSSDGDSLLWAMVVNGRAKLMFQDAESLLEDADEQVGWIGSIEIESVMIHGGDDNILCLLSEDAMVAIETLIVEQEADSLKIGE